MRKFGLLGTSALRSAACIGLSVAMGAPAFAQGATDQDPPASLQSEVEIESGQNVDADAAGTETITVTGSRIRRPNLESTVPITSISGESFIEQGNSNVGDTLNELPQLRSTRQQSNPTLGIGIAGLNLLDLRGLGTNRTLVLVNGRRHVASDITSNGQSPDINTIPNDLIERVDIVTGGNSAIYGSDAIAGVVNFVLRRDFDGVQVRGNAGVGYAGYGGNQYVSVMAGKNFASGRGNITLHAEYAHQDRIFASDIPYLRTVEGLGVVDSDPAGTPNGSDGNPDRVYFKDIRQRNVSRNGLVIISQPSSNAACGLGVGGTPYNCIFSFDQNGQLRPSGETTRFSTGPIGGAVGGNLDNGREEQFYSVIPKQDRYNANLLARYQFTDALEAFVEAKFVRVDTQGSNPGAAGIQGTLTQFDIRERIRLDNPFLSPEARTTIANALLASGCVPNLTTPCSTTSATSGPLTAAQRAAIADGSFRFVLARQEVAGGIRDEIFQRDTYRVVGGLRGTFNDDWTYEISANYGRMEEKTSTVGYVDRQRLMLSLDAGRNPTTGQIQCRSQFDPAARVAFPASSAAKLDADIAACVPFNPFGQNDAANAAARSYFNTSSSNEGWTEQLVLSGFVSGDTSQFFNLPGGPVRFAVGAEYRKEDIFLQQDAFTATGATNNVVLGTFIDPKAFTVKEAFGELQIPVLADMPFFHELTLSGAARVAKYQGGTGTVYSYNAGIDWAPIRDVRFRANYSRAVRAPYLTETGGTQVANFSQITDPCNPTQIGAGTQFRAANCQADLGSLLSNITSRTYSLQVISGSNPNLSEETSDSYTLGVVIQPRFVPGLSLSVDYYDITVKDIIFSPTAQQILNSCYDQQSLDNVFCKAFTRFRGPGLGPFNETPGDVLGNSLIQAPLNFAKRTRRGIDAQLAYRTNLSTDVRLNTNLIYTRNFEISNFENPADPTFENRILGELGDPEEEFRWDTDVTVSDFTFGYRLRYIGEMWTGTYEAFNSLQGRPPQDADFADIEKFPKVFYHDFRFEWDVARGAGLGKDLNFYFGVDNAFNRKPPLGATGAGGGGGGGGNDRTSSTTSVGAIYEARGRQFYAGFRARF